MNNGTGDDGFGDTPNELPQPTIFEHRPYVLLLADIAGSLHQSANTFAGLVRELRLARDPIGPATREKVSTAFAEIEELGRRGRVGFGG